MATAFHGRPNLKWQRRPDRIPSSTEPPSIGSNGVRIETQCEGALADRVAYETTTLALDRMCLLMENPIEEAFAKIKALLRKAEARSREVLIEAMGWALEALTARDARNFFEHRGYRALGQLL
jgi:hypothetical protein